MNCAASVLPARHTVTVTAAGARPVRAEYLRLLRERERGAGLRGDPETDAFLKAAALQGKRHSVSTEYIIRLLGLDVRT